jgi:cytoskeleton protein RodZ
MSSIGETLRRERLRRNLDLEQISRELKISQRFLEAIEAERFDRLPAMVFAKSFVRQYAGLLGLDQEELAAEVQRVIEPPAPVVDTKPDLPPLDDIHLPRVENWEAVGDKRRLDWSSSLPALALLVVVLLVCSGVYAFWQRARAPMTAQAPPPMETAAPQQQPAGEAPATQPPPAVPEPQTSPPAAPAPSTSADRTTAGNGAVKVQLTADEAVWVLARGDGKFLFSGTLEANEVRSVEANEMLTLRLGNAGGVTISLNGKPIGPVGPKGQVREVQFTSGGFQIVAAPKPSLPDDKPI